uniref:Uncharacterized protein n=1 Tax=viral metagenome TaxID=1070528 RepID=A0A6C0EAJ4_9ZZZZ
MSEYTVTPQAIVERFVHIAELNHQNEQKKTDVTNILKDIVNPLFENAFLANKSLIYSQLLSIVNKSDVLSFTNFSVSSTFLTITIPKTTVPEITFKKRDAAKGSLSYEGSSFKLYVTTPAIFISTKGESFDKPYVEDVELHLNSYISQLLHNTFFGTLENYDNYTNKPVAFRLFSFDDATITNNTDTVDFHLVVSTTPQWLKWKEKNTGTKHKKTCNIT